MEGFFCFIFFLILIFLTGPIDVSGEKLLARGNENGIAYSAVFPILIHPVKVSLCTERGQDRTEPSFPTLFSWGQL